MYLHLAKMRLIFVAVAVAALLTENLALPVGKEGQREDVVTRCLVEVLSKALSRPDSQLDQECKDLLQAGVNHAPLDKKSGEGIVTHGEVAKGYPEEKITDVKDIEALLQSVEDKRDLSEDERSQESWSLGDEKEKRHENEEEGEREKRSSWKPGRYHQRKHKRGEEEKDEDNERSQESWGIDEKRSEDEGDVEQEKRNWRPGRYHQRKHKRNEESFGGEMEEPEEERSQEYWDVDKRQGNEDEEERDKRIWKPTHRYHHKKKLHKRGDEPLEEEEDGERSQESWGLDKRDWRAGRFHQRRHKRDEELAEEAGEEPEEERSQESWDFDTGREKREWRAGRYHQRRHKRDEELSEEVREEPEEERSQESWGLDKRHGKEEQEIEKRIWKPTHRYHHKKKFHKRGGSEEEEEQRGDSEEYEETSKDGDHVMRYLAEKRNPWIFRGFYHPAWYKRDSNENAANNKMDKLAKVLSYKINQLASRSNQEEPKRSMHQRALTPPEEKELENLAAMDTELQKIAAKLHDNSA
ncbi:secretogranin-1 isoform X3 [Etheostoma cragini]|uniref:secretogranin-1 isoform X3 n=1 Tax=Etheostoma cragini TaxID=417921 RepID=UPI00155E9D78|nr:secretogranin-1 isoform X3 [Etheostoma cragini]